MNSSTKKWIKLLLFNVCTSAVTIILYSPGLIGLSLSMLHPVRSAICVFSWVLLLGLFVYINYALLVDKKTVKVFTQQDFEDTKDYSEVLRDLESKCFDKQINKMLTLISRFEKKKSVIISILGQFFSPTEMSYQSFTGVLDSVASVFFNNVQNAINRIQIFDYSDYKHYADTRSNIPESYIAHIDFVWQMVNNNEQIIQQLDALLLEVSKLTDTEASLERLPAMRDLQNLIETTRLYKD